MPAGRPPKPIEQHIREGTFKPSRHAGAMVVTGERGLVGKVDPPAHFTQPMVRVWNEIAGMLDSIVRESDAAVVEGAVVAFFRYREASEILTRDGLTIVDDKGNEKVHPAATLEARYLKLFLDFCSRLGLSPADRARLGLNVGKLAKTAGDLMRDRYGDGGDGEGWDPDTIDGHAEEADDPEAAPR